MPQINSLVGTLILIDVFDLLGAGGCMESSLFHTWTLYRNNNNIIFHIIYPLHCVAECFNSIVQRVILEYMILRKN